ncbi:MAG: FadR family transcriptional regulator [Planctomycetaceae bacterium]|nr:FadR family transcriptional regulator [Planctomycetaceae bacterium]
MEINDTRSAPKVSARLFRSSEKPTAVDRVVRKFKELLISRELRPGDRIPNEKELAESFHTSRGSVREAIKMLASSGILKVKWGDGTFVSGSMGASVYDQKLFSLLTDDHDKLKLVELRSIMEMGVVDLAITHASEEDIAAMEESHQTMIELVEAPERDRAAITAADLAFHQAIARATHNPMLEKIYVFTLELFTPTIEDAHMNKHSDEEFQYSKKLHQSILDSITAKDREKAHQAVLDSLHTWVALMS